MQIYEDEPVSYVSQKLVKTVCDLCGRVAERGRWDSGRFAISETTIEYKEGLSYPEYGNSKTLSVDICPQCFKEKLLPWLRENGAVVKETEIDF